MQSSAGPADDSGQAIDSLCPIRMFRKYLDVHDLHLRKICVENELFPYHVDFQLTELNGNYLHHFIKMRSSLYSK